MQNKENWAIDQTWKNGWLEAAADFENFRNHPYGEGVVENTPEWWINKYLDYFRSLPLMKHKEKFRKSDLFGNPKTFEFEGLGRFAPTTLRYVMTLESIRKTFGNLTGMTIAEIGAGYGGLCKIIHDVFKPKEYVLFDLPEVIELQKTFLGKFGITPQVNMMPEKVDLVIATNSWSELNQQSREQYYDYVIKPSKHGFFFLNDNVPACIEILLRDKTLRPDGIIEWYPTFVF